LAGPVELATELAREASETEGAQGKAEVAEREGYIDQPAQLRRRRLRIRP